MKDYPFAVFIARLQPPHRAHIQCIERALDKAEKVIVVLGSHRTAPNIRNPWTADERADMVKRCFDWETCQRLHFVAVRDQPYNDTNWMADVHTKVSVITGTSKVALVGHPKDRSSFYLEFFPQWDFIDLGLMHEGLNATAIRDAFFEEGKNPSKGWQDKPWSTAVADGVRDYMEEFRGTEAYDYLAAQWLFVQNYKAQWSGPHPHTFTTTDAVVVKSGHVLLVRRGFDPGKGLLAVPGGFLNAGERLEECMLRELKEETRIKVKKAALRIYISGSKVFDDPDRSARGRTITHAYYIKLPDGGILPEVRHGSDAKQVLWMPLGDLHLHEREFYEDHIHIIEHFTNA